MNVAFLLITTACSAGAPPGAPPGAPIGAPIAAPIGAPIGAPVVSAPISSSGSSGSSCGGCGAGSDCGGATGCGAGSDCGGDTGCCEKEGCLARLKAKFSGMRGGHGCGCEAAPTCCSAPAASCCSAPAHQTSSCGATSCGCDDGCGAKPGLFARLKAKFHRGNDCGCDTGCGGCDGCGSYGGGAGYGGGSYGGGSYGGGSYGGTITGAPIPGAPIPGGTIIGGTPGKGPEPIKKMPNPKGTTPPTPPPGGAILNPVPSTPPATLVAPAAARSDAKETTNPFELDRRYEERVSRSADYSKLTGQLFFVHADGGLWVLRYAPLGKEDPNGGSVILARDRQMDTYREGDLVSVQGQVINERGSPRLGGPLYRLQTIQLLDRPQH